MDILLNSNGDLHVSPGGDIAVANSVAQKIRIRLLWFAEEWRWNKEQGMPYRESLLIKNPDIDYFESAVRSEIFDVDEVTEVKEVTLEYDPRTRKAVLKYVTLTDYETIKEEVKLDV